MRKTNERSREPQGSSTDREIQRAKRNSISGGIHYLIRARRAGNRAYTRTPLRGWKQAVLVILATHVDPAGRCTVAVATIASETGASSDTVAKAIDGYRAKSGKWEPGLEELAWLKVTRGAYKLRKHWRRAGIPERESNSYDLSPLLQKIPDIPIESMRYCARRSLVKGEAM